MLSIEQQYFIELMTAFIQKKSAPTVDNIDWVSLCKLAQKQSLTGVLAYMVKQLDQNYQPQNEVKERLEKDYYATIINSTIQDYELKQVWAALNSKKIIHVPMKGYVLKTYWPVADLRTMGDIDYLVHEEDCEKSRDLLLGLGYKVNLDEDPVWVYQKGTVCLEEHRKIEYQDLILNKRSLLEDCWDNVVPVHDCTYALTLEYHAMFLIVHLAKHLLNKGCGLRQVMDIAIYFNKFQHDLNWDELWKRFDKMKLSLFAKRIFSYCYFVFGMSVCQQNCLINDELFFEQLSIALFDNGVFGNAYSVFKIEYRSNHANHTGFSKKWYDLLSVLRFLFPTYATLCQNKKYTYIKKHPWLIPAAYVNRAFSSIFKNNRKLKHMVAQAVSNYKNADDESELYSKMGFVGEEKGLNEDD